MRTFLLLIFFCTCSVTSAHADPEDIVHYDLSLAGYRLGMSYDDAALIRPFQYVQNSPEGTVELPIIETVIEQVYLDDVEMDLWVSFREGKIFKIIARFPPADIKTMVERFRSALGSGENKSKTYSSSSGVEVQQTVYRWEYPGAQMHLIGISSVKDYATISLVVKKQEVVETTPDKN